MIRPNIEELIRKSGYRKDFLAEKLNVSTRQLRKYETGDSLIPIDKAYKLADLLECKVDDLYERVEENESID